MGRQSSNFKQTRIDYWSANADFWASYIDAQFDRETSFMRLVDRIYQVTLSEPQRILDLGCGEGSLLRKLAAKFPEADLFGLDICPKMVELARLRSTTFASRIKFVNGDFESHKPLLIDGPFDLITAVLSLIEAEDITTSFYHISRLLECNGVAVVVILDSTTDLMRLHKNQLVDGEVLDTRGQDWLLASRFRVDDLLSPCPYFRFIRPLTTYMETADHLGMKATLIERVKGSSGDGEIHPQLMSIYFCKAK